MQSVKKDTPILVIGFGSIGRRHYRNLLALGYSNIAVYDIDQKNITENGAKLAPLPSPSVLKNFTVVFVCNPTDLHVKTALMAINAGCHVFIEKPLAHERKGLNKLLAAAKEPKKHRQVVMVGCNYRFHPGFLLLAKKVRSRALGKPLLVHVAMGHDLSRSRAGVDYRKTYAADPKKGGGVILDSGSHVIDYLTALFGPIKRVSAQAGNVSTLKITAEDFAQAQLVFAAPIFGTMTLDYFGKPKRHALEVQCEKGMIRWDFADNITEWYDPATGQMEREKFYEGASKDEARNDMYMKELEYFFEVIRGKAKPVADLAHAVSVTEILFALKKSVKK
jgi:predicted dehydrogenase